LRQVFILLFGKGFSVAEDILTKPKKLNRIVIKEEFVVLTVDFKLAIVLNGLSAATIVLVANYTGDKYTEA